MTQRGLFIQVCGKVKLVALPLYATLGTPKIRIYFGRLPASPSFPGMGEFLGMFFDITDFSSAVAV